MMAVILPSSLVPLTLLSVLFTAITFILSLVTFSLTSMWLSVIAAALTIVYHGTIFIVSWRRLKDASIISGTRRALVSHSWKSIAFATFTLGTWLLTLAVTVETTMRGAESVLPSERNAPWNRQVQTAQSVLLGVQILIFGGVLAYCINGRRVSEPNGQQQESFDAEKLPESLSVSFTTLLILKDLN
jgi:hypothetical protein